MHVWDFEKIISVISRRQKLKRARSVLPRNGLAWHGKRLSGKPRRRSDINASRTSNLATITAGICRHGVGWIIQKIILDLEDLSKSLA
ncbi:hypothetical protein FF011L_29290 [Roseimaritima multifibrata]|uniref:Uncharacterized protein n=1 Tax=Roseimaritima multifibrata TaxID=1930274 RepID=A0A517MGZ5_9BACT|nr:hypothetical protein FF011L_29290 [Roseimaritima multifibrata]